MAHTCCVFSTKDRCKIISGDLGERLWAYLGPEIYV